GLCVGTHRRAGIERHRYQHALRIVGIESDARHRPGPDAVEQHAGAGAEPRHRLIEADAVDRALAEATDRVHPIDESKAADQADQREQADDDVAGAGFHAVQTPYCAAAGPPRSAPRETDRRLDDLAAAL